MNNCESTEGSTSSSSDIEEIQQTTTTVVCSEATTASEATTKTTTTTSEFFYTTDTSENNNKLNENLENDTKCAGNTGKETPAAIKDCDGSKVAVSSLIAAGPTTAAVVATKSTVSYAAIAAMDTASATAFVSAQQQQKQQTEAIISISSDCDKNSTKNCDNKNSTKPQETAEPVIVVVSQVETASDLVECSQVHCAEVAGNGISNSNQKHDGVEEKKEKQEELSVVNASSSPALSPSSSASSLLLIENKEKISEAANISTTTTTTLPALSSPTNALSGSKLDSENSGDITVTKTTTTTNASPSISVVGGNNNSMLLAQKKIDNNHHHHRHHHLLHQQHHAYALTTTSSAPILMQCSNYGGAESSSTTISTGSGTNTTMTVGLNAGPVITRRVSFPKSDEALVTGYLEPANPWEHVCMVQSISEIAELYVQSCNKHNTIPIPSVLDHLKHIELDKTIRQPMLLLKNTKLMPADCEALEEIFKRVQYKSIDVSSCELNEAAASALFDMFEYYEVTNELDISSNADGMTPRGWTSCIYMISHSRALQVLNAQGNPLSKNCADNLGSALNASNLHTIKLEHCGLRGNPLDSLCTKLRNNQILKELWLAYNDLTCLDADKIAQLLKTNHYLQLIDISNNNIKDEGLMIIVKALIEQSTVLERQKIAAAAQAFAISEADHKKRMLANSSSSSSNNSNKSGTNTNNTNATTTTTNGTNGMGTSTDDEMTSGDSDASPAEEEDDEDEDDDDDEADDADVDTDANDAEDDDGTTTEDDGGGSRVEDDDDDEDTVKTSTIKSTPPINGQSKLDKLLSMNNSDSSEEAPTDTVAASDISVSDDIFDSTNAVVPVVSSTPIVEPTLEQPVTNNNNNTAGAVLFEENDLVDGTVMAKAPTPTKALDVNKNSTKLDDFDDTHSTDSAFESSSDGDISRHLPDEFVDRFDGKDEVETATIATEALTTPTPTPPPPLVMPIEMQPPTTATTTLTTPKPIEVTPLRQLAPSASPNTSCDSSSGDISALKNAALTGISPCPSPGMRRTESTCTITQSTRVRSHSSDSLSSDNSLDGSISDNASGNFSTRINEKLTKNDTLTRQKQFDVPVDSSKTPHGLKALALWNNNLTKESGPHIADLLATTVSLELLNIGKNILSNDFVASIRDSLSQNTTLTTLGLQSAHLSCAGIRTLSSILQFGGNSTLHRIDIRDNKIEVESLNMLAEALKSNTTVTQIDIDDEPKRLSIGSDAQLDYARVLENVRSLCSRNENQPPPAAATAADKTTAITAAKRRGGYYLGSRKISLTCHSAPPRAAIVDQSTSSSINTTTSINSSSSKLEVKKKTGVRLRSPIPSPPTISPSSSPVPSPSKSRFQVFRVSEVSPLTSPMTPSPSPSPTPSPTPLSTASGVIINSKDSTTTIKRLSTSPRSRFHVMKIYEDPGVPIAHRTLPPITPSPSPPTAPSIKMPPFTQPITSISNSTTTSTQITATTTTTTTTTTPPPPPCTFEEQKIITTPATPPIVDNATAEPSFNHNLLTTAATTATTTTITNNSATNTKTNLDSRDLNKSTNNTVKPNDRVDAASASVASPKPPAVQVPPHNEDETTKCQKHLCSLPPPPPLPVVEDDQRTLTNNPDVNIDSIAITTVSCSSAQSELTTTIQSTYDPQDSNVSQDLQSEPAASAASPATGRTRKNSWIPNSTYPGTVDRLLSMFQNPAHLFHRSSSPDTTSSTTSNEDRSTPPPIEEDLQQSLVPVRRRTPPAANQFPWCKLGTEMCKPVTSVMQTAAAVSSGYVACGPPTTAVVASVETPRSFFDAASKQLRDFSKQVFRQNIAFGNEAANINQEQQQLLQHDCDIIPSDMKLEIKENISPEHTINEEQLQSLQKIGGSPGSSSTSSSGTETTEGASLPSSSSSPSSLLSVPLIGIAPTIPLTLQTTEQSIGADGGSSKTPQQPPPPPTSQPQPHVPNEEQSCNS